MNLALQRILLWYRANPARFQPTASVVFIVLGIGFLNFSIGWTDALVIVLASCILETALQYVLRREFVLPWAALSTAFSLVLFFRAIDIQYYLLAVTISITSKYLIRLQGSHIFNPSNLGIVALTYLFPAASTVQFIEWGNNTYIYLFIVAVTLFVSYQTRTLSIALSFLASYVALLLVSVSYLPETFSAHHFGILSPVVIIYATFMITDPKTAPRTIPARILYSIAITLIYFLLELHGTRYGLFVALFLVLALNALFAAFRIYAFHSKENRLTYLNIPTMVIALVIFVYAYAVYVVVPKHEFSPTLPSLSFVLFGIQTSELFSCSPYPALQPHRSGVEAPAVTTGAAWGDYNGDGYDDLFVSNWDKPSRLYRNNGDGTFTDVTAQAGLPMQASASAFFVDYDNSGRMALFVVDPRAPTQSGQTRNPYGDTIVDGTEPALAVYRYQSGAFTDITSSLGLGSLLWQKNAGGSMSFGDYNNDGLLDFTLTTIGEYASVDMNDASFRISEADPTFISAYKQVCDDVGVHALLEPARSKFDAATLKLIDTFLAKPEKCLLANRSLVQYASQRAQNGDSASLSGSFVLIVPGSAHMFQNTGHGFIEQKGFADYVHSIWQRDSSGFTRDNQLNTETLTGRYFQPISFDYNGDGKLDMFISVDFGRSMLLENEGNWTFKDVTKEKGMDISGTGMGVHVADLANAGRPDILVTNVLDDFLYRSVATGTFKADTSGISRSGIGWGNSFLDYNLDGWQDVYIANGDFTFFGTLPLLPLSTSFFRADRLYENVKGELVDRTWHDFCPDAQSGKTAAVADYDNDGDPDVFVGNINMDKNDPAVHAMGVPSGYAGNVLYQNTTRTGKSGQPHYLEIDLQGTVSNRMGIGAVVHVRAGGMTQTQFRVLGSGFFAEDSETLNFGLASNTTADISVQWPSGRTTTLKGVKADQRITVRE